MRPIRCRLGLHDWIETGMAQQGRGVYERCRRSGCGKVRRVDLSLEEVRERVRWSAMQDQAIYRERKRERDRRESRRAFDRELDRLCSLGSSDEDLGPADDLDGPPPVPPFRG